MQNQLILGDCFDVLKTIPDRSFDAIITDPPYFNTNLAFDKVKFSYDDLWREFKRVIKDKGMILIFSQIRPAIEVITSNPKWFRYEIVWNKTMPVGFLDANIKPLKTHELILVFSKILKGSVYNPQKSVKTPYHKRRRGKINHYRNVNRVHPVTQNKGERFPTDVITFSNGNNKSLHPTQKPLDLIKYLVKTYTNESQLILDPFAGSGTTAIACLECDRDYFCIEKDPEYHAIASKRITEWHNEQLNRTGTHKLPENIERINLDKVGQLSLW